MKVTLDPTPLKDVFVVSHDVFENERGFFMEVYRRDLFEQAGLPGEFLQLNHPLRSRQTWIGPVSEADALDGE